MTALDGAQTEHGHGTVSERNHPPSPPRLGSTSLSLRSIGPQVLPSVASTTVTMGGLGTGSSKIEALIAQLCSTPTPLVDTPITVPGLWPFPGNLSSKRSAACTVPGSFKHPPDQLFVAWSKTPRCIEMPTRFRVFGAEGAGVDAAAVDSGETAADSGGVAADAAGATDETAAGTSLGGDVAGLGDAVTVTVDAGNGACGVALVLHPATRRSAMTAPPKGATRPLANIISGRSTCKHCA